MGQLEGKAAPAFVLKNQDGEELSLASLKGKTVVLFAYPKASTPGCTIEAKEFTDLLPQFRKRDVAVLGISADSEKAQKNFATKSCLAVPLLSDPDKSVIKKYGFFGEKQLYGRKFEGIIRSTAVIGPDGKVMKVFEGVKAKGHAQAVLDFLLGNKPVEKAQSMAAKTNKKPVGKP